MLAGQVPLAEVRPSALILHHLRRHPSRFCQATNLTLSPFRSIPSPAFTTIFTPRAARLAVNSSLACLQHDPEMFELIELEKARQWSGLELIASEVRHFCASQSTLSLLRCCVDGAPTPPRAHAAVAYSFAHERHTPASFPHTRLSLPHIHLLRRTSRPRR